MRPEFVDQGLLLWLAAVNSQGDPLRTADAVAEDIQVDRYGFGAERGRVVERLSGRAEVARWLAMTRTVCVFSLVAWHEAGEVIVARYRITADEFVGGGTWRLRLDGARRVAWLGHVPDELPADV